MKKCLRLMCVLFFSLFFINSNIYAEEDSCEQYVSKEAKEACKAINSYCYNAFDANSKSDFEKEGCIYDPNDSKYTTAYDQAKNGFNNIEISGELTRAYEAIDKDGYVVFAGCYKVEYPGNGKDGKGTSGFKTYNSRWAKGTYYLFKILSPNNNCEEFGEFMDIVPPDKIDGYNGQNAVGGDSATYKWVAKDGGECPKIFGLTSNTTIWTAKKNSYVFSDDVNELNIDKKQFRIFFWNSQQYEVNAGCTVKDKEGYEKAIACYEKAINEINSKSCPSDLSDISSFKSTLEGIAKRCNADFDNLYKVDLLKNNADTFKANLIQSSNEKLTACQYKECNLTKDEIKRVTNSLSAKSCKDGCASLTGNDYDYCIDCIEKALGNARLSSNKEKCLLNTQKKKDAGMSELEDVINEDQDDFVDDALKATKDILDNYHKGYYDDNGVPVKLDVPTIPGSNDNSKKECSKVLGKNFTQIVKTSIVIIQVVAAIIAIVKGMMVLIPPILSKDSDALKKAFKTLTTMAIILVIIFLFKPLLRFIGNILDFDLSCII